uniref:Phosphoinositide phospholipase C n=1 Tax=Angiostrongylus cantonensis TaxID=6313 RepID=A0A0K0DG65_ANGCA
LMARYANKDYLSCQDLRLFLETEQGMLGVTTQFCKDVVEKYEPAPDARQNNFMTVDGSPFSKYFIASSHKTYLVDDRRGPVSVDGLSSALERNCRLIELDVWDPNESHGDTEPMVQNGVLATSKLPLSEALNTICEMAFERTRYPLLLQLSVQCSHEWQKEVAKLLTTHLGTKLYVPSTDPTDWTDGKTIPTPWDFQLKILIMGRRESCSTDSIEIPEDGTTRSSRRKSPRVTLCKELSDLVPSFLQVKTVHDLMATAPNSPTNTSRNDSTNLNPQEFWNHGVQLVALNYQTPGLMIDLQQGRFSENGGCGYVLKPAIMDEELFVAGEKPPTSPQILHLRILSGQQLPRPRGSNVKGDSSDPFVVIEIFGIPSDCAEERTKTVKNDGHNPSFDESFQFQVSVPELALVRFLVLDDEFIGDDFIGQYTIPFECLQPGKKLFKL